MRCPAPSCLSVSGTFARRGVDRSAESVGDRTGGAQARVQHARGGSSGTSFEERSAFGQTPRRESRRPGDGCLRGNLSGGMAIRDQGSQGKLAPISKSKRRSHAPPRPGGQTSSTRVEPIAVSIDVTSPDRIARAGHRREVIPRCAGAAARASLLKDGGLGRLPVQKRAASIVSGWRLRSKAEVLQAAKPET